jgi:hypothetical protein
MIDKFSSKKFRKLILSAFEYNLVLTATEIVLFLLLGLFHCIGEIHVLNGGSWHLTFCGCKHLVSTKLNPLYKPKNNNMREKKKLGDIINFALTCFLQRIFQRISFTSRTMHIPSLRFVRWRSKCSVSSTSTW